MCEAKQKDAWARTSTIIAYIAEPNRDKKKHPRPFHPDEFNPFKQHKEKAGASVKTGGIKILKIFTKR